MNYKHTRTGGIYRKLHNAFDVSRQVAMVVYLQLDTGAIFTREETKFREDFEALDDPQSAIVPKEPHE